MTPRVPAALLAAVALLPGMATAGALAECQARSRDAETVARCLTALDLETLAALKEAEQRAAAVARDLDERTKRGSAAYAALAQSSRAFALYQGAQCDYVHTSTPGANLRPTTAGPSAADVARIACRVDIARQRIDQLGN